MDCGGKSSVDFCGDLACAAATVGLDARDDLKTPHVPTHEVFKVYTVLHGRRHAMTEKKAKNALKRARLLLPGKIPGPSSESTKPAPKETVGKTGESDAAAAPVENTDKLLPACSSCKGKVALSPPCWTCVECGKFLIFFINTLLIQTHSQLTCSFAIAAMQKALLLRKLIALNTQSFDANLL